MSSTAAQQPPRAPAQSATIVSAQGLVKTFTMGESVVQVLKGVDISIKRGEFLAIEGRSGSGKSTLLHLLGALDEPDRGTINYNGTEYSKLTRRVAKDLLTLIACIAAVVYAIGAGIGRYLWPEFGWIVGIVWGGTVALVGALIYFGMKSYREERLPSRLRRQEFGFVFQFYHLLPELNVLENTMLTQMIEYSWFSFKARKGKIRERAEQILKDLGMEHRLTHRPNQLSGGERQRVAIARALMNDPKVLFADEPTGNLDAETGRQIMTVFERLHRERGQTIVMVTHDRTIARQADRVLVLKDGKIERPGDPQAAVPTLDYR